MDGVILDIESRVIGSKKNLAFLRKNGKIPAVFYGKGIKSESIAVNLKAFTSILETNGTNAIIYLNFKNARKSAIVKSIQKDILSQSPIHVDFQAISLKDKVEVFVPVHIEGVADGVKNFGGVMEFVVREIKVEALPENIPQKININIDSLAIGQGMTIADLPKIEGVDYLQDPSTLIVHVVVVSSEEGKSSGSTEGGGTVRVQDQPEVIGKGKKGKEGDEIVSTANNAAIGGSRE
ncbi:MAG: 50S ribosomal protein L25 [Endomicrobium sp.]|jgi:large subunit ribosomal protein L25|nr:50S ribosomal protein L25 [Endomicrobium sp.]